MKHLMGTVLTGLFMLIFSSASFAFSTTTHTEIRNNETWVTVSVNTGVTSRADVLFVIDDSGSMHPHQKQFAAQAPLIANELSFYADLNAAVISSSATVTSWQPNGGGAFHGPVLNANIPNFAAELARQITSVGTSGDATERFLDSAHLALSEPLISTKNAGFLRDDADLILVFLTDTEDQSTISADEFHQFVTGLKPNSSVETVAVMTDGSSNCPGETWELKDFTNLRDFVAMTNGSLVDLCSDFSQEIPKSIKVIKENIKEIAINAFPGTVADFSTMTVKADNKPLLLGDVNNGWTYDSNRSVVILGTNVITAPIKTLTIHYKLIQK